MLLRRSVLLTSGWLRRVLLSGGGGAYRTLLSQRFALDDEWLRRYDGLRTLGITGSYEWITAVQKKFVSAAIASAVDVDAAVCAASEDDQVDDIVRIVYKLRHTVNAGDTLASTEYALLRLLLKYHRDNALLAVVLDPINFGVFVNEHVACLIIDHFLNKDNIAGAVRVANTVMLQEMFESNLLNLLCVFCALKWTELPVEQRVFEELPNLSAQTSSATTPSASSHDDDERIFKFPYLKNNYNDGHFDLSDPNQSLGKSLLWFVNCLPLQLELANNIRLIGHVYLGEFANVKRLLSDLKPFNGTVDCCNSRLDQLLADDAQKDNETENAKLVEIKELFEKCERSESVTKLSETLEKLIMTVKDAEEEKLMKFQTEQFEVWKNRRIELVQTQVERLELTLRLADVRERRKNLREKWEILNFFENRLHWEEIARTKIALLLREKGKSKSREELEQEYIEHMFLNRNAMGQKP